MYNSLSLCMQVIIVNFPTFIAMFTLVARPTMDELICIKKEDSTGSLRIIDWITSHTSAKCDDFAHKLLKDSVANMKLRKKTGGDDEFVRDVLKNWLSGPNIDPGDKAVPCTWEDLVQCVEEAGLDGELVKAIRDNHPKGL